MLGFKYLHMYQVFYVESKVDKTMKIEKYEKYAKRDFLNYEIKYLAGVS